MANTRLPRHNPSSLSICSVICWFVLFQVWSLRGVFACFLLLYFSIDTHTLPTDLVFKGLASDVKWKYKQTKSSSSSNFRVCIARSHVLQPGLSTSYISIMLQCAAFAKAGAGFWLPAAGLWSLWVKLWCELTGHVHVATGYSRIYCKCPRAVL